MGATKLKSCFKQIYGCTITEYIKQRRIEHAKSLLASSDFSIEQIAKTVGYSNAGRFAGDFRNGAGVLPMEFRKNTKK
ncbi:MAG: helix-turn-helix transcriptional regulator [Lachnospiraceae bacterium]|nr:helix-turn-helix transcriptional regulator [Lachnospiraceae bacterium]